MSYKSEKFTTFRPKSVSEKLLVTSLSVDWFELIYQCRKGNQTSYIIGVFKVLKVHFKYILRALKNFRQYLRIFQVHCLQMFFFSLEIFRHELLGDLPYFCKNGLEDYSKKLSAQNTWVIQVLWIHQFGACLNTFPTISNLFKSINKAKRS